MVASIAQEHTPQPENLETSDALLIVSQEKYQGVSREVVIGGGTNLRVVAPFVLDSDESKEEFAAMVVSSDHPERVFYMKDAARTNGLRDLSSAGAFSGLENTIQFWSSVHESIVFEDKDHDGNPDPYTRGFDFGGPNGLVQATIEIDPEPLEKAKLVDFLDKALEHHQQAQSRPRTSSPFKTFK